MYNFVDIHKPPQGHSLTRLQILQSLKNSSDLSFLVIFNSAREISDPKLFSGFTVFDLIDVFQGRKTTIRNSIFKAIVASFGDVYTRGLKPLDRSLDFSAQALGRLDDIVDKERGTGSYREEFRAFFEREGIHWNRIQDRLYPYRRGSIPMEKAITIWFNRKKPPQDVFDRKTMADAYFLTRLHVARERRREENITLVKPIIYQL